MAITLMKAVLTDQRFSDPDWVFERKLDGIRVVATKGDKRVDLRSRNDLSLTARFGAIAEALTKDDATNFTLDGEVVAFNGKDTSFAALANSDAQLFFYVFDILRANGEDVTHLPWRERKQVLSRALTFTGPLRLSRHRNEHGEQFFKEACEKGWEGLIAKRADAPYKHGRSKDWLKFKCTAEQELVIGGFTAPKGSRTDLGALLIGHYEGDDLKYAGKVGTGFTQQILKDLAAKLTPLHRDTSPFHDAPRLKNATWVQPELVAQIAFTEWTRDGRLRHPSFLGLRDDKAAKDVVREDS